MKNHDYLLIEANMMAYNGRHWDDLANKRHTMEYGGHTFVWNPDREFWDYFTEG